MNRNYFYLIVGLALLFLALIFYSFTRAVNEPIVKTEITPSLSPFPNHIAGTGTIEPSSGKILIGAPMIRVVDQVHVNVGDKVQKGQVLFTLQNKDLIASLFAQKAAAESARAELEKLEAYPRPEDLVKGQSQLDIAKSAFNLAKLQYEMVENLPDPKAISQEERSRRLANFKEAEGRLLNQEAEQELLTQGTWAPDIKIARLKLQSALSELEKIEAEIARTIITSPIDGTILQVNTHPGEVSSMDSQRAPMMIVGNTKTLHLKVSINQFDTPYFRKNASAVAFLRGDSSTKYPLTFIRTEPLLVNRHSFTNEITEKVDTKVLQVIYEIKRETHCLLIGEQLDVFIETIR